MWLDNLKEFKKEANMSTKQLAERSNLPEKTVARILSGKTANPYIDTLDRLAAALNCTIGDILAGTKAVVGDSSLSELHDTVTAVTAEKDVVEAEKDLIVAENNILKDKVNALTAENELLKTQLAHKEELLAVHNYYNKLLSK
jgi:transcriptional regulator with XRE-family HTH domain